MNRNRKNYLKEPELKCRAKRQQQQRQVPKVIIQLNGNTIQHPHHTPKVAKILLIITKSWKKLLIIRLKNRPVNSSKQEEIETETMIVEEEESKNNNNKKLYRNRCF